MMATRVGAGGVAMSPGGMIKQVPPAQSPLPVVVAEKEAEIILPPATSLNPIPKLPAALRIDNQEQIVSLLRSDCRESERQLLVFATDNLRTLIMRQVLCDPNHVTKQSSTLQKGMKTKKNWDDYNVFPNLPRGLTLVGTTVLNPSLEESSSSDAAAAKPPSSPRVKITHAGGVDNYGGDDGAPDNTELRLQGSQSASWDMGSISATSGAPLFSALFGLDPQVQADVITYFLRPYDLIQTQHVIKILRSFAARGTFKPQVHHRIVYIPQPTALVSKILSNYLGSNIFDYNNGAGTNNPATNNTTVDANENINKNSNISIKKLQLDLFPLENDILSLEMEDTMKELHIEGTPSNIVTTMARSICKLQDITGKIPRIQTVGPLAEEILRKYLAITLDEYLVSEKSLDSTNIMSSMMIQQNQQNQQNQNPNSNNNSSSSTATNNANDTTTSSATATSAVTNTTATTNTNTTNMDTSSTKTTDNTSAASIHATAKTSTSTTNNNSSSVLDDDKIDHNHRTVQGGDISAMIIIDRKVDMVTPMVSPLTYEGLLDEIVGIDCGFIQVDVNTINPEEEEEKDKKGEEKNEKSSNPFDDDDDKKQSSNPFEDGDGERAGNNKKQSPPKQMVSLGVNGSDTLYTEVRDQHVEKFGSFLQNQAMALRESHANFTNKGKKKDLSEIHQFVKQIPIFTQNLRSLTNHIHLAELIKAITEETIFRERWVLERSMIEGDICYDNLEDLIACRQYDNPYSLLRLLCLQSLTSGGIKSSRYDTFKRDIIQTYGYEYLFVLGNLEKVGLLRRRETIWMDTTSPFNNLRKSLILVNAEVDTVEPDDVSYVSSGYAPLSIRLIQASVQQGWLKQNNNNTYTDIINQLILSENPGGSGGSGHVLVAGATSGTISHISQQRFIIDITQQYPPEDYASSLRRSQIQQQQVQQLQQSSSGYPGAPPLADQQQQPQHQHQPSSAGPSAVAASVTASSASGGGAAGGSGGNVAKAKLMQQLSGGGPYSSLASVVSSVASAAGAASRNTVSSRGKKPTLMVFFVGGVTYMEIAAMRFLSKRPSFPYHILCCTTKVINGNTFLESLS